ncbi:hypothetical protein CF8_0087 [Aeromonas phage CF8]|nr:hypothetical protein CF8_0087 [Aeromonas phage CF8]
MNVNIDQMDHVFDTIDGFESISNKDFKTVNAKYTQTVLRLNGCDLAVIAGQEGLGTAIKEGAKKVLDMLLNLIKAVKDFFFGSKGKNKEVQMREASKQAKQVLVEVKKAPALEEKVAKNAEKLQPSMTKIAKAATHEKIELVFGPYVNFMSEYFETMADAKTEGYLVAAQTGKASLNKWRTDNLKLLAAFNTLAKSFTHRYKDEETKEVEAFAVIESIETGNKVIAGTEAFRDVAKDGLKSVNETLEGYTAYYESLIKEGDKAGNAEQVLKFIQSLGKVDTKMAKLVSECDEFIITIAAAIARLGTPILETEPQLNKVLSNITSTEQLDDFMNS